jgi:hypothetical protein
VDVTTEGDGRVTGPELDCGDDCRARRPAGSEMALTAAPGAGQHLERWVGGCTGDDEICTQVLTSDLRVSAFFAPDGEEQRTLTIVAEEPDRVTVDADARDCSGGCALPAGSAHAVTATPPAGTVAGWTGCDSAERNTCSVTLDADRTVGVDYESDIE